MSEHWEQIQTLQMSLQTAELRLGPQEDIRELRLSCSLLTIARGSCLLVITAQDAPSSSPCGSIHISADRPIMTADVILSNRDFDNLTEGLGRPTLRPVSIILALQKQLSVSVEGYLRIEDDQHIDIVGISTQIPLK